MGYVRCYADDGGESHFEDVDVAFTAGTLRSGVPTVELSAKWAVAEMFFVRVALDDQPALADIGFHTAPDRRFVIYLAGEAEQQASDGELRRFGPGDIVLFEDTTGRGHRSYNLTSQTLLMLTLRA